MNALQQTFSRERLYKSWKRHSSKIRSDTTPGVDGIDKAKFHRNLDAEIISIATDIARGLFRFRELKPIAIPKQNGEIRLINVPTIRDRFVQKVIIDFLNDHYRTAWKLPHSFSSLGGNSEGTQSLLNEVAKKLRQDDYVIKADLSKYFDTIDRSLIKQKIRSFVRHKSFHPIIFDAIDCETSTSSYEDEGKFRKSGLQKNRGIRQGMPLSPVLSYLYLQDIDRKMTEGFYRYVDDIVLFGDDKTYLIEAFNVYKSTVELRGLKVHPLSHDGSTKTRLYGPRENFDFLGIRIARGADKNRFMIPTGTGDRIKREIFDELDFKKLNRKRQKGWLVRMSQRPEGLVRNYRGAYGFCENWREFETSLREMRLSMCREIVRQVTYLDSSKDRESFLRAFGI